MPVVRLRGYRCLRCEHEWVPREDKLPKVCPRCKSHYWNKRVQRVTTSEAAKARGKTTRVKKA